MFCRLNSDEQIQMVTALALELIQCVVKLPSFDDEDNDGRPSSPTNQDGQSKKKDVSCVF